MIEVDMSDQKKEFFKAEELAEMLQVNIMTIYRYIKAGKLQAYKIGKEFRIDKKTFDEFLKSVKT
ncbi:MAG: helix-turn-helix domain-containing protein [Patescibacteria group bacterium]